MEVASHAVRQIWGGRSLGKTLLLLGMAVVAYQAYRRWRRRRALSRFRGKVVLITGASSGLGEGEGSLVRLIQGLPLSSHAALARVFYSVGAKVILASRDHQKLQALKFQLDNTHTQKDVRHFSPQPTLSHTHTHRILSGSPPRPWSWISPSPTPCPRERERQWVHLVG